MKSDRTIYPAVVNFFNAYLVERDISKTLSLVTADVYSIGTGEGEVAVGREEFAELLRQEVALLPGPIRYVIRDYTEKQCSEECWQCFCRMETCIGQEGGDEVYYKTRLTAAFHLVNGEYLASALHMSEPSGIQEEEEFFPLRYISKQTREVSENAQRELLDIFCRMMPGGIIGGYIEEDFPLYVVNDTMLEMLGYSYEEFMHACGGYVANTFCAEDREWVTEEVHRQLREGSEYAVEYRIRKKDGSCIWVHDVGHTITAEDGREAIISVLVDISSDVRLRKKLEEEASRDFLTGVYNRKGGELLIREKMKHGEPYLFLMLDLDNFKRVNDFYGHEEGDEMLRYMAGLLIGTFRQTDVVIRLGGDEFAVFIQPCYDLEALRRKIERAAEEYRAEALRKYPDSGTSVSIGGICGSRARSFMEMYNLADSVLYEVKHGGKGQCRIREE